MKYVYHGSMVSGLKEIMPNKSTHNKEWVYGTKSKVIATIFLKKYGSDLEYYLIGLGTKDNPATIVERLTGEFDKMFNNSGSIYKLDAKDFLENQTKWNAEVIAEKPQEVIQEEYIENIFNKLLEYEKENLLIIYRYPNRPSYIPLDNSDLISIYLNYYNAGHKNSINNLVSKYPEFKNKIDRIIETEKNNIHNSK